MPNDKKDSKGSNSFVTIKPADLTLGGQDPAKGDPEQKNTKTLLPLIIAACVVLLGIWVFLFLPDEVSQPDRSTTVSDKKTQVEESDQSSITAKTDDRAPFEILDAARARKATEETLAKFVQLQIKLEDTMQVRDWASEEYSDVIAIANQGDALFLQAEFDASMEKYSEGSAALSALVEHGEQWFEENLSTGKKALEDFDVPGALLAFQTAAVVHPDDPLVLAGQARSESLPQVLKLLKQAEKSVQTYRYDLAVTEFRKALALDPQMPGIKQSLAELRVLIREQSFRKHLSEAYAALGANKYTKADSSFSLAEKLKPGHASIRDGKRQLANALLLAKISALREKSESQFQAEQWSQLPATYQAALKLDPNLKFARDGIRTAKQRDKMNTVLNKIIANPGSLSSDNSYSQARSNFAIAMSMKTKGPVLTNQLERVQEILDIASVPVMVQVKSDNFTEVGIVRRGSIGVFKSKSIELRPGTYIFTGSRPGCRDVRKEIDISQAKSSISVQCEESI